MTAAAIRQGLNLALRSRPAVWVLFLLNLGVAALGALPIYRGILRFTGFSLMSQTLAAGFSQDWLRDFTTNSPGSLERYARVIALFGLLSIPLNSVLAGGVLATFRTPKQRFSLAIFFGESARYAWRLIRLMILGLVCYWIVFWVFNKWLWNLVDHQARAWSDDRAVFGARLAVAVLVVLGLAFVNLVIDYARIKLVLEESSSAFEATLAALGFSLGRFREATAVYAVPSLGGIALLGIYWLLVPWHSINASLGDIAGAPSREPLVLALLFLGQQLVIFGRYWFRVATWASEWSLCSAVRRESLRE